MTTVESPGRGGYGWSMDDSARLREEVARRAAKARPAERAPILDIINRMAARHGVNLSKLNDPEYADQLLAEAERNSHRERLARQADILLGRLPSKYRNADLPRADFGRQAKTWLDGYRDARTRGVPWRNLAILGETGTGKTWVSCAIARALLLEDTIPVTVVTVADMLAALRPAAGGLDVDLLHFSAAPVLVMDDLGSERLTEWGAEQLYRLADERCRNDRPTIVTANMTGEQIKATYDRRTVERLFGGAMLIQLTGETRRPMPF